MDRTRAIVRERFGAVLSAVAARAAEVDRTAAFPEDVLELYQRHGLMAAVVPEEFGGLGMSHLEFTTLVEEVAHFSGALSLLLIVQAVGTLPVVRRTEFPRREEVLRAVSGDGRLLGFALTEPSSGSDAYSLASEVAEEDGQLFLSGSKYLITNAEKAHAHVVFAAQREPGVKHVSAFLVDADRPGFRVGAPNRLLGMRGLATAPLYFHRVPVSERDRIGGKNDGYVIAMDTLNVSRPWIAAQAVGLARGALEAALRFACQRRVMGSPLADKQGIQFLLADVAARVEAAGALVERTSRMVEEGREDYTAQSAMCKLFATETAMWACERCLQVLGGPGCLSGNRVERAFRDAKITQIYEGTSEIQRLLTARELIREGRKDLPEGPEPEVPRIL
ncbi:MAG: acyl-CoA dehydrogenase family protein [Deferrisomatales bacterium]